MADPKEILSQYEDRPPDEDGFLFSTRNGQLRFNPWESVKSFMGSGHAPGYLSTSGDTTPITSATDTAGWLGLSGLGLNWAGAAPTNAAGIFGGRLGAKTLAEQGVPAPQKALELAERMKAAGASRDEIWRETAALMEREDPRFSGVHYGKDYLPRFEIPDRDARWPEHMLSSYERRQEAVTRPGETLEHPLLYSAYPEMRDVAMRGVARSRVPMEGSFDSVLTMPGDLSRAKIEAYGSTPERARQAALHELQHATQFKENLNRGSNPGRAEPIYEGSPILMSMRDDLAQLHKRYDERLNDPSRPIEGFYDDPEVKWMLSEMERINKELYPAARLEGYRRSAGETEARNVEKRARMTPEQLRRTPPWETQDVPDAQQILEMYGTGPQRMASESAPIRGYHGARQDYGPDGYNPRKSQYKAFFGAESPELANSFARHGDGHVYPIEVSPSARMFDPRSNPAHGQMLAEAIEKNPALVAGTLVGPATLREWALKGDGGLLEMPGAQKWLRQKKFDGWKFEDVAAHPGIKNREAFGMLRPGHVKSATTGKTLYSSGAPVSTSDILRQYDDEKD